MNGRILQTAKDTKGSVDSHAPRAPRIHGMASFSRLSFSLENKESGVEKDCQLRRKREDLHTI